MMDASYPVQFSVDYPERPLNRLTTLFRIFTVIPIAIVLGTVSASTYQWSSRTNMNVIIASVGGLLFVGPLLMILFRQKYPRWWFDWNAAAGQVVSGHPSLRGAVLPGDRGCCGGHHRLVRHPVHRALPESPVRLCRGSHPLAQPGYRLCASPRHRPVPTVPAQHLKRLAGCMNWL
jgi:hypothetical protein